MGFVKTFQKDNVQEAYLPKLSISGQVVVSEILAQLCSDKFDLGHNVLTQVKFRRICMETSEKKGQISQRQFASKC